MQECRRYAAGGDPPAPTTVLLSSRVLLRILAWRSPLTELRPRQQVRIWSSSISVSSALRISASTTRLLRESGYSRSPLLAVIQPSPRCASRARMRRAIECLMLCGWGVSRTGSNDDESIDYAKNLRPVHIQIGNDVPAA